MNWKVVSYLTLVAVVSGVFCSCYKTKNFSTNLTAQLDSAVIVQSYDQARVTAILDDVFNDVDSAMNAQAGDGTVGQISLCGTSIIVDTVGKTYSISITYNGNSCDNTRARGGNVTIYFIPGTSWVNQFDTIGVNITKLNVRGTQGDTNLVRLTGTFFYANSSGGSLSSLTAGSAIVHDILSPYLGVLFNSADTATWQVARRRTYTNNGSGIVITTTGIDSVGGVANVSEWGGNRYGNSFITAISTDSPLVSTAGCGYQLLSGKTQLTNPSGVTTMNFGLTASGAAATGCPAAGSYSYFQFSWTGPDANPYGSIRPYPFW